jgi:hypothetical protein
VPNWKAPLIKTGVIALGVGAGVGLVALGAILYSMTPDSPKAWNSKAITATYDSSMFSATPSPAGYFTYTLQNNTNKDYSTKLLDGSHLPSDLRAAALRGNSPKSSSLAFGGIDFYLVESGVDTGIQQLADGEPLFIPAKQRVEVRLRWEFPTEQLTNSSSANIVNTSLFGFVLYDDNSRYEINFPQPKAVEGKFTEADISQTKGDAKTVDPAQMKPWEFYGTCERAARFVSLCRTAKIKSQFDDGMYFDTLPALVSDPPNGQTIQPDQSLCDNAVQWQNYCGRKK